ncbi:MAG: plasmid pRiA4b ORF-3 family protein [Bacteroidales bacterium]|nr:plasmid pRiA4b ORF-3 family protein [Bacteroidales bacterium]
MSVFRLRVMVEDQDDFIREVDIKSNQTFRVLHDFLVKSLNLDSKELASFHITDDNWRKLQEITLIDMSGKGKIPVPKGDKLPLTYVMDKSKLEMFLDEIDQKMIYEYDFLQMHTFMIELIDIDVVDEKKAYPFISYSNGRLSLREKLNVEKDAEKLKQELLKEFNAMMNDDDEDDDNDIDSDDY